MTASAFTEILVPLSDIAVAGAALALFARGLRRADIPPPTRSRALGFALAGVAVWYLALTYLAWRDVFTVTPQARIPTLPITVVVPVVLGLIVLPRSRSVTAALDATPISELIAVQTLRVMGVVFLVEWALGSLPAVFAFPAALGDIATGLLALPVARRADKAPLVLMWSALGLGDFVSAMATGFLSSPGRFQMLALDQPNLIGTAYPLALIPTFGVPIFILLHGLTLWKLRRGMQTRAPLEAHAA